MQLFPEKLLSSIPTLFPLTESSIEEWRELALLDEECEVLLPLKGNFFALKHPARTGERVTFRADPYNQHDKHAVRVLSSDGTHIGWLPKGCGWPGTATAEIVSVGNNGEGKQHGKDWDYFDYTWLRPVYCD